MVADKGIDLDLLLGVLKEFFGEGFDQFYGPVLLIYYTLTFVNFSESSATQIGGSIQIKLFSKLILTGSRFLP
jgi:hypothetical protein